MENVANQAPETPSTETPAEGGEQPSNLPSAQEEASVSPWERARKDGFLPDDFKEDPYELAKSWKHAQDYVKDTNLEKRQAGTAEAEQAKIAKQTDAVNEFAPEFIKNGYKITDEMLEKAKEVGIDERDLKIKAYELKDTTEAAYSIVGGQETYAEMMRDMGEIMTDDQKRAFNAELGGGVSEYAIRGLKSAWEATKTGQNVPGKRIEGKPAATGGVKGYGSQAEMMKDLSYLKTRGKNDKSARMAYEQRMANTPDQIVFGR